MNISRIFSFVSIHVFRLGTCRDLVRGRHQVKREHRQEKVMFPRVTWAAAPVLNGSVLALFFFFFSCMTIKCNLWNKFMLTSLCSVQTPQRSSDSPARGKTMGKFSPAFQTKGVTYLFYFIFSKSFRDVNS